MTFDDARQLARDKWGRATAFRVGYVTGHAGKRPAVPYAGRLLDQYHAGRTYGLEMRARERSS